MCYGFLSKFPRTTWFMPTPWRRAGAFLKVALQKPATLQFKGSWGFAVIYGTRIIIGGIVSETTVALAARKG